MHSSCHNLAHLLQVIKSPTPLRPSMKLPLHLLTPKKEDTPHVEKWALSAEGEAEAEVKYQHGPETVRFIEAADVEVCLLVYFASASPLTVTELS